MIYLTAKSNDITQLLTSDQMHIVKYEHFNTEVHVMGTNYKANYDSNGSNSGGH